MCVVVTNESAGVNEAPYQSLTLMISGARGHLRFNFTLRCFSKASGFGAHSVQTW